MYAAERVVDEEVLAKLPEPSGYKILVGIPKIEDKTAGGVILPDKLKDAENMASIVGFVIKLGPDCYADPVKFPSGAWCKPDDYILFRSYSGTRFKIGETEFRLINDDTVEAVVEDPRGYRRA